MDNISMGKLTKYVESVTNSDKTNKNENVIDEKIIDDKEFKSIINDIKNETNKLIKKSEKAYNLQSKKELYDFLVHLEMGLSSLN